MTLHSQSADFMGAEWLFAIGEGGNLPAVDGLVAVADYDRDGRPPEEVAIVEKAGSFGARAVFFEAGRHGRAPWHKRWFSTLTITVMTGSSPTSTDACGVGRVFPLFIA